MEDPSAKLVYIDSLLNRRLLSKSLGQIIKAAIDAPEGNPDTLDVALFLHVALTKNYQTGNATVVLASLLNGKSIPLSEGTTSLSSQPRNLVSPGLAQAFDDAFDLRKQTDGDDDFVGLRYVLFAIFTNTNYPLMGETDAILIAIGISRLKAGRAIRDYCLSVMEPKEKRDAWDTISRDRGLEGEGLSSVVALIGADDPLRKGAIDRSGSQAEADAFAAMITARQFVPPLAIGVFGEWGSGKSFFMRLVYDTIESRRLGEGVAKAESDISLLDNVVQIRFNAWHYAETNLWASLVDNIFTHLDRWAEKANQKGQTDKVFDRLATARKLTIESAENLIAARTERDAAKKRLDAATQQLAQAKLDYAAKPATWIEAAFTFLLPKGSKEKVELDKAAEILGLGSITTQATSLYEAGTALDSAVGSFGLIKSGTIRYLSLPLVVGGVALATIILPPVLVYCTGLVAKFFEVNVSPIAAAVSGALAPIVAALGVATNKTKDAADKVRKFHEAFNAKVDERAKEDAVAAETAKQELEAAASKVRDAEDHLRSASAEVALAADEYNLKNGKGRTIRFVRERVASGDYAKHLGFIATVRKDFDELSVLMSPSEDTASSKKATELQQAHVESLISNAGTKLTDEEQEKLRQSVAGLTEDLQVFERIVLYIDDLDRCPPQQVVEVLQAVNMLLAFPLFVVMVAVDVRWLRTSLISKYQSQIQDDTTGAATPGDYLEKIFQIPYWVRPLTAENTADLLNDHLGPELDDGQVEAQPLNVSSQKERPARATFADGADIASTQTPERVLSSLRVSSQEREFMKQLAGILDHSPRRTLRFVNSYRVIKASLSPTEVARLNSGGYRALLVLLALATCAGEAGSRLIFEVSGKVLPPLGDDPPVDDDEKRVQDARSLIATIKVPADDLKRYAPMVARFSFERHW